MYDLAAYSYHAYSYTHSYRVVLSSCALFSQVEHLQNQTVGLSQACLVMYG